MNGLFKGLMRSCATIISITGFITSNTGLAWSESSADDLSQQLANPLASLISVPLQNNFDFKAGANKNGFAYGLNIQPVIPFSLNVEWNLISRTIIPIAYRDYMPGGSVSGLGDINASFFLSPTKPGPGGLIWGVGPVFLLPTATDEYLGSGKFGLGPTAVALVQEKAWTVGALGNHVWSVAGPSGRQDVSASLLQPFVSYNFGQGRSMSLSVDSTYDWEARQWLVPINLGATQVFKVNDQAMSLQVGGRYYADGPAGTPEWGLRTTLTLMFPE
ncbi:transporter [Brucella pituitosa]|uniref:transporter n=1 Tax=Brucella pituitosa TaxID=571256 RepID=UPI003F4ACD18